MPRNGITIEVDLDLSAVSITPHLEGFINESPVELPIDLITGAREQEPDFDFEEMLAERLQADGVTPEALVRLSAACRAVKDLAR